MLGWSGDDLLAEEQVVIEPGKVTDIGGVRFTHPFHHYELQVTRSGVGDPDDGTLQAYHSMASGKGELEERPCGWLERDALRVWHFFTIEPVSEIRATFGDRTTRFPISEGENQIQL